jgi:flagellin
MSIGVVANTNIPSISASRILSNNRDDLEKAMERLSSGKRINSASDDAAGMAVAAKLRADVRSLNQAVRNANDAVSLVNTYDGASAEIESILVRMRELAVQTSNGTYQDDDRALAQEEIDALAEEIDRIALNTTFNRQNIASGSGGGSSGSGTFTFRVGPQSGSADDVDVHLASLQAGDLGSNGVGSLSVGSASSASDAVEDIDAALAALATARAVAGAFVNRLGHTVSNLQNVSQRTSEALSGVEDADYAAESANLARGMVLAQAGTAMLAQANQSPQYILTLLRG